jgi:hypothetical protein
MVRQPTEAPGSYELVLPSGIVLTGKITVKDISMAGLGIEFQDNQEVEVGDVLNVDFTLNHGARLYIKQTVVVRNVREGLVGTEFAPTEVVDRAIGSYMAG